MAKLSRDLSSGTLHPRENITGTGALGALNAEIVINADGASTGVFCCPRPGRKSHSMTTDPTEAIRLIQSGLDRLGHTPGAIDGQWGVRTRPRPGIIP